MRSGRSGRRRSALVWLAAACAAGGVAGEEAASLAAASYGLTGVYFGWADATGSRLALPVPTCAAGEGFSSLSLRRGGWVTELAVMGGASPGGPADTVRVGAEALLGGTSPGALARPLMSRAAETVGALAGPSGRSLVAGAWGHDALLTCRDHAQVRWTVGDLSATAADAPLHASAPLRAFVVNERLRGGPIAMLVLFTGEDPAVVDSVELAGPSAGGGPVLVAVGGAEHLAAWRSQARAAAATGHVPTAMQDSAPSPYWSAAGPAPSLVPADPRRLALELGPHAAAIVVVGRWSVKLPRMVSFPVLVVSGATGTRRWGAVEPLVLGGG